MPVFQYTEGKETCVDILGATHNTGAAAVLARGGGDGSNTGDYKFAAAAAADVGGSQQRNSGLSGSRKGTSGSPESSFSLTSAALRLQEDSSVVKGCGVGMSLSSHTYQLKDSGWRERGLRHSTYAHPQRRQEVTCPAPYTLKPSPPSAGIGSAFHCSSLSSVLPAAAAVHSGCSFVPLAEPQRDNTHPLTSSCSPFATSTTTTSTSTNTVAAASLSAPLSCHYNSQQLRAHTGTQSAAGTTASFDGCVPERSAATRSPSYSMMNDRKYPLADAATLLVSSSISSVRASGVPTAVVTPGVADSTAAFQNGVATAAATTPGGAQRLTRCKCHDYFTSIAQNKSSPPLPVATRSSSLTTARHFYLLRGTKSLSNSTAHYNAASIKQVPRIGAPLSVSAEDGEALVENSSKVALQRTQPASSSYTHDDALRTPPAGKVVAAAVGATSVIAQTTVLNNEQQPRESKEILLPDLPCTIMTEAPYQMSSFSPAAAVTADHATSTPVPSPSTGGTRNCVTSTPSMEKNFPTLGLSLSMTGAIGGGEGGGGGGGGGGKGDASGVVCSTVSKAKDLLQAPRTVAHVVSDPPRTDAQYTESKTPESLLLCRSASSSSTTTTSTTTFNSTYTAAVSTTGTGMSRIGERSKTLPLSLSSFSAEAHNPITSEERSSQITAPVGGSHGGRHPRSRNTPHLHRTWH